MMDGHLEKLAEVQSDETYEQRRKNAAILVGKTLLNVAFLATACTLSYMAIEEAQNRVETDYAYPVVGDTLYARRFEGVNTLRIDIDSNSFTFLALRPRPPEPEDVVGELVLTRCKGTYTYDNNELNVSDEIVCADEVLEYDASTEVAV